MAGRRVPAPPKDLERGGRQLWRETVKVFDLRADEVPVLAELCRTVDELASMGEALREQGLMVTGSMGQSRPNPLLVEIRGARQILVRLAAQLGLPDEDTAGAVSKTPAQRRASKAARARWGVTDGAA